MGARLISIVRFLFRRRKVEHDLDVELRYHVDRQTELNLSRGMEPEAARREARLSVGGVEALKDECREARTGRFIETLWQDVRYGMRVLRKNPAFSLAAILTLALGIGANTAIFSLVYGVLLRPLPYKDGGQLVVLHQLNTKAATPNVPFSVKELSDYGQQNHTLDGIVEHHTMVFLLSDASAAERVQVAVVSGNFFDVLGVRPLLGRTFIAADDQMDAAPVIVLSYKYWQQHRNGDPAIVGKVFEMNSKPHTVIGVLPPIPQYPSESDLYMTTVQCPTRSSAGFKANRRARMMIAFARLKPGVKLEQAQADLSVVASGIERANPDAYPREGGYAMSAVPLRDDLTHTARTTFFVLLAGAGFVLLIACANVANLMLARLLRLEREIAVRAALGASKGRLLRQLLTESILVSLTGGLLGLAFAPLALSVLVKFAARYSTRAAEVHIDAPVLLFTLLMAAGTGIVFGLAPAFSSASRAAEALKQGSGRTTAGRGSQALRNGLVVAQVAVSFILLIGAGLMLRSFIKLTEVNPGFRTDHLLSMRLTPNFAKYTKNPSQIPTLMDSIMRHVNAINGVELASLVSNVPLSPSGIAGGPGSHDFLIFGRTSSPGKLLPTVDITVADSNYFETIRQPVIAGRDFTMHDDDTVPPVAVINQTMALTIAQTAAQTMSHHGWPSQDAVGQRIAFAFKPDTWITIVGVVADTREYGLASPTKNEIYMPMAQNFPDSRAATVGGFTGNLIVRSALDPSAMTPLIRAALGDVDPFMGLDQIGTLEHFQYESVAAPRVTTTLLGVFAALALLISSSGIAAVMTLSVTERHRELGIRMALGAERGTIVAMVVRRGLALAFIGIAAGICGAMALTRLLATLLYSTSPTDVATFLAVSLVFLAVGAVACFIPARQVTAIDPVVALREE
jgi:putative ABC transport system permease protein